ncbi:hypothetical protein [Salinigranum marinum]|uniref:hypothetical protein n=1 Tax=Salinigranum marinum TaxID=1515595 RepID=UPI002989BF75|nr:hypothetical protein [Salinigranum marinum]
MPVPSDVADLTDGGVVTRNELTTPGNANAPGGLEWAYKLFALEETGQIRDYSGAPYSKHIEDAGPAVSVDVPGIGIWSAETADKDLDHWLIDGLDWQTGDAPDGSYSRLSEGEKAALSVGAEPEQVVGEPAVETANHYQSTMTTTGSGSSSGSSSWVLAAALAVGGLALALLGGN